MNDLTLKLDDIRIGRSSIHARYLIDDLSFSNTIWYQDIDFRSLVERYGATFIDAVAFHIAAFEINKIASLRPVRLDWGRYRQFATHEFKHLWVTVFRNVWAQWRYENNDPDYFGPTFEATSDGAPISAVRPPPGPQQVLAFCGGGKDSLVAMKTLDEIGMPYDSLAYAASFYGTSNSQHELIGKLLARLAPRHQRRQWIADDFVDMPVLRLRPDFKVATVTAAETPSSIFNALPYALQHGYRYFCLAHERSADAGQLIWDANGEEINHQWGKSFAAEQLINGYIKRVLIPELDYFSILKPIYDLAIFGKLRSYKDAIPATHSCNVRKPWCLRCPKCLYVWLGYAAFLDADTMKATFGDENLLDVEENVFLFRQLVGLEDQLPFECIGEAKEAAMYLAMCRRRGYRGRALEACRAALDALDEAAVLDRYLSIDVENANLPPDLHRALMKNFSDNATSTRSFIEARHRHVAPA
jgi:UDP-N-acetyl-alpha-D-muramoyl-L-alanyl-L-glutamate epimerase